MMKTLPLLGVLLAVGCSFDRPSIQTQIVTDILKEHARREVQPAKDVPSEWIGDRKFFPAVYSGESAVLYHKAFQLGWEDWIRSCAKDVEWKGGPSEGLGGGPLEWNDGWYAGRRLASEQMNELRARFSRKTISEMLSQIVDRLPQRRNK